MESITAIADTGFIVALTNIKDIHHQNVKAVTLCSFYNTSIKVMLNNFRSMGATSQ